MKAGAWETPFGPLPVETAMAEALSQRFSFRIETPQVFTQDNTIELQLPFIKYSVRLGALLLI
jgi:AmmeMemoRadiSam system protein B